MRYIGCFVPGVPHACVAIAGIAGVHAMFRGPHEIAGEFAMSKVKTETNVQSAAPASEWRASERTSAGLRHTSLTRITPANGGQLRITQNYHAGKVRAPSDLGLPIALKVRWVGTGNRK